jgi:hypothetical protein
MQLEAGFCSNNGFQPITFQNQNRSFTMFLSKLNVKVTSHVQLSTT